MRERERDGEGERKADSGLSTEPNSGLDYDLSWTKNQALNQLSHPGVLKIFQFYAGVSVLAPCTEEPNPHGLLGLGLASQTHYAVCF